MTVVEALTGVSSLRVIRCMSVHARDRGCRKGRGGRNRSLRRHNFNTRGNHVDLAVAIHSVRESLWLLHALPVLDDVIISTRPSGPPAHCQIRRSEWWRWRRRQ